LHDKLQLPENVQFIIKTLESAGFEAFIVGGCVRDILRGVAPKDWDITTSAQPGQAKALFSRTVDTGIKHGTITVLCGCERYEVTTYRADGEYLDKRRPSEVFFSQKIEDDLSRRDFTVNAVAYSPGRGFVDPFDGCGDINRKIIRCVGNAAERFNEDALRMLRAIRFAAVLGFEPELEVVDSIIKLRKNLSYISAERIREELGKLIFGKNPAAIKLLETTGIMHQTLRNRDFGGDLDAVISQLKNAQDADESMRFALFFAWASDDCREIMRDLRFDNKLQKTVALYVQFLPAKIPHKRYEIKKILNEMPPEIFEKLLILKKLRGENAGELEKIRHETNCLLKNGECFTRAGLAVNGNDLAKAGIFGRTTGETLKTLLDAVMRDPSLNKKEKLLCLLK